MHVAKSFVYNSLTQKYLILKRSINSRSRPSEPDLPGGKVEDTETPLEGIKRELFEETGLTSSNIKVINSFSEDSKDYSVFKITIDSDNVILSHEHQSYTWVNKEELENIDFPKKYKSSINKL